MKLNNGIHLSYCTNIHPAESWKETFNALRTYALKVRDLVQVKHPNSGPFALGMRLSAQAAEEFLEQDFFDEFQQWLSDENCYVYTINGFPYGAFHNQTVKENVYAPDWTSEKRLQYTLNLFKILSTLAPAHSGGSVSTLPGSFKEFEADESLIFTNLWKCALGIAKLSESSGKDLHLGLEPEPLGHFENTDETIRFFRRFFHWIEKQGADSQLAKKHIGLNYDTCHFALEYEDCAASLQQFQDENIRISKVHLSNAIRIDLSQTDPKKSLSSFNEPTYLHQVLVQNESGEIRRYRDLPEYFKNGFGWGSEARVHFHVPLYANPDAPLQTTQLHSEQMIQYLNRHPHCCNHLEMETYTWNVLPKKMQSPIESQLAEEYFWTLNQFNDC